MKPSVILARLISTPVKECQAFNEHLKTHAENLMSQMTSQFDRNKLLIARQELFDAYVKKQDKRTMDEIIQIQNRLNSAQEIMSGVISGLNVHRTTEVAARKDLFRAALDDLAKGVREEIGRVQAADQKRAEETGFNEISSKTLAFLEEKLQQIDRGLVNLNISPQIAFSIVLQVASEAAPKPRKEYDFAYEKKAAAASDDDKPFYNRTVSSGVRS